jgi:hypothetical protein
MLNGFLYSCEYLKMRSSFFSWISSLWWNDSLDGFARTPRHSIDLCSKLIKSTHAQTGINVRQYLFAKDEEEKNPLKQNKWNAQEKLLTYLELINLPPVEKPNFPNDSVLEIRDVRLTYIWRMRCQWVPCKSSDFVCRQFPTETCLITKVSRTEHLVQRTNFNFFFNVVLSLLVDCITFSFWVQEIIHSEKK